MTAPATVAACPEPHPDGWCPVCRIETKTVRELRTPVDLFPGITDDPYLVRQPCAPPGAAVFTVKPA